MPFLANTPKTFKIVEEDVQVGDKIGFDLVIGFYTGSRGTDGALEHFMRTIEFRALGEGRCAYLKSWLLVDQDKDTATYELVWGPSELGMAFATNSFTDRLEDRPVYPPVAYVG